MGRRIRATVILKTKKGTLLVSHSRHGKPTYMLPGGGVRKDENPFNAAKRELYEETGLHADDTRFLFDMPTEHHIHKVFLVKKYHGKLRKRKETTHIRFYNRTTKNRYKLAWHVKPIIKKFYNLGKNNQKTKPRVNNKPKNNQNEIKKNKSKIIIKKYRDPIKILFVTLFIILLVILWNYFEITISESQITVIYGILAIVIIIAVFFILYSFFENLFISAIAAGLLLAACSGIINEAFSDKSIKNPTYNEMMKFIDTDKTDSNTYVFDSYVCEDFSNDVIENAKKKYIRAGLVHLEATYGDDHAIVCFGTSDKGLYFLEPQLDVVFSEAIMDDMIDRGIYDIQTYYSGAYYGYSEYFNMLLDSYYIVKWNNDVI